MKLSIQPLDVVETVFLTSDDIPPNLKRIKVGDELTVKANRRFVRCGYRLTPAMCVDEVRTKLNTDEGRQFLRLYRELFGSRLSDKTLHAIAYDVAGGKNLGGCDRGVEVEIVNPLDEPARIRVVDKRCVTVGEYYPPTKGGYSYDYGYESGDPGGLLKQKTVIVVEASDGSFYLSGDLTRSTS